MATLNNKNSISVLHDVEDKDIKTVPGGGGVGS